MGGTMERKTKLRIITVVALIVFVTALSIWMRKQEFDPAPVIAAGSPQVTPASGNETETAAVESLEASVVPASQVDHQPDPEFGQWLKREAKELDNVSSGGEQKEIEMRRVVAKITPNQSRQLLQTIKNPKAPAGEKILSTYLLVEGGAKTQGELADLIAAPLTESQEFEPHSVDEIKGVREKSLRIMAIDGLFSQAQREPSARTALAKAAEAASDPTIRAYAEDKLRQLQ
jgi:hypothetical protein